MLRSVPGGAGFTLGITGKAVQISRKPYLVEVDEPVVEEVAVEEEDEEGVEEVEEVLKVWEVWEWDNPSSANHTPGYKIVWESLRPHTSMDTLRIVIEYLLWPTVERNMEVVVHTMSEGVDAMGKMRSLKFSCLHLNPVWYLKLLVTEQLHPEGSSLVERVREFDTMRLVAGGKILENEMELCEMDCFDKKPFFHCYLAKT
jgi:hypothetical protein